MGKIDQNRPIHSDCLHFVGDRPCKFHKDEGITCGACHHYHPVRMRILIIKLGAMGDVLRTTSILPTLSSIYERPHVTWVTAEPSLDLLRNNRLIDSLMKVDGSTLARLQVETFDLVINPEAARESAALATLAKGNEKRGFGLTPQGTVFPFNEQARELFQLGLFDDLKKDNQKTYEQLICRLVGIPWKRVPPMFELSEDEIRFKADFSRRHRILTDRPVIGINTGGGGRWPLKRWTVKGFKELAQQLMERAEATVLLLGGPTETQINREILSRLDGNVIYARSDSSVRRFGALIDSCDVVLTGDSLALHLALALGKRVVTLFGPTSATEIDLYDRGTKVSADKDCLGCYRQRCSVVPNCMESISVETVYDAIIDQVHCRESSANESLCHTANV